MRLVAFLLKLLVNLEFLFPGFFQFDRHQTVVGINPFIATLGQVGLVASPFEPKLPLLSQLLLLHLGLLDGSQGGFQRQGLERLQEQVRHGLVNMSRAEALAAGRAKLVMVSLADVGRLIPVARPQRSSAATTQKQPGQQG